MNTQPFGSYRECIAHLYSRDQFAIKLGLENIQRLLESRGSPEKQLEFVHVAGTNGKGSFCRFLQQLLEREGVKKIGLYTSPHLVSFRERINIDQVPIPREYVLDWVNSTFPTIQELNITYFECVTAMAMEYFRDQGCSVCILETGMGGRLDATNCITPKVCAITPVSMDHMQYLGTTQEEIWKEKIAIMKPGVPCILNESRPGLLALAFKYAESIQAPLINIAGSAGIRVLSAPPFKETGESVLELKGKSGSFFIRGFFQGRGYQTENLYQAMLAAELFMGASLSVSAPENPFFPQELPARQQVLSTPGRVPIVLDGAHNQAGIDVLVKWLKQRFPDKKITLLFSMMADKDYPSILRQLNPLNADLLFLEMTQFKRALGFEKVKALFPEGQCPWRIFKFEDNALESLASSLDPKSSLLVISGSLYLMGMVIPRLYGSYPQLAYFSQFHDEFSK